MQSKLHAIVLFTLYQILYAALPKLKDLEHIDIEKLVALDGQYNGPVSIAFLTPHSILIAEKTAVSQLDLKTRTKSRKLGSGSSGGYVDGFETEARFGTISDIAVQDNYVYIADYSCVRLYDRIRNLVATLAGSCGRLNEHDASSVAPPTFTGSLKLAVCARGLYVLDNKRIYSIDKEIGTVWLLSEGEYLQDATPSDIDIDPYSNTLFVTIPSRSHIKVIAIDTASGKQRLYTTIFRQRSDYTTDVISVGIASIDVAADGSIYVLEPQNLYKVARDNLRLTNRKLEGQGHYGISVSSEYLVITQEFYSRMYNLHIAELGTSNDQLNVTYSKIDNVTYSKIDDVAYSEIDKSSTQESSFTSFLNDKGFYYLLLTVVPSITLLLIVIIIAVTTRQCTERKHEIRRNRMQESDLVSDQKYFLNSDSSTQWNV